MLLQSVKRVITRYDKCYYKVRRVVEKYDKCCYQVRQVLLQTVPSVITKRGTCFLTKNAAGVIMSYDKWYSTGWQVLSQSVTTVLQIAISVITKCDNCSTDCDKCHNKVWQFSKKAQRPFRTDFKNRIFSHCSRILGKLYRRGSVGGSGQQRRRGEGEGMHNTKEVSISGRLYDR